MARVVEEKLKEHLCDHEIDSFYVSEAEADLYIAGVRELKVVRDSGLINRINEPISMEEIDEVIETEPETAFA